MPLGFIPGTHPGCWNALSHRLFGSRKFSRTIEYRIIHDWLPQRKVEVLDVAAGVGELSQQLALLGHSVTALDYDAWAVQEINAPGVPLIRVVIGDAHRLPFPDSSFDLVVCNSAVEHFTNDEDVFDEMARVLRPDGILILTTDSFPQYVSTWLKLIPGFWRRDEIRNASVQLSTAMRSYHQQRHHVVNYYSPEMLEEKLRRHGFKVKDFRPYLNGRFSRLIFEAHILVKWLDLYNDLSRRMFPFFYPFTFPGRRKSEGYGLAACAVKASTR